MVRNPVIIVNDLSYNFTMGIADVQSECKREVELHKDSFFICGPHPRLINQVVQYANIHRIPNHKIIKLNFPDDMDETVLRQILANLYRTNPIKLIVFRDNKSGDVTGDLVDHCLGIGVKSIEIDSQGNKRNLTNAEFPREAEMYYRRNPNDRAVAVEEIDGNDEEVMAKNKAPLGPRKG